tara:strand:- start:646 stop:1518 length:873 start_codon:yes stop_codon:yes gene_type:complete
MNDITKIDSTDHDYSAILYGGEIRTAGTDRNYKSAVFFDNDVTTDASNTNSYAELNTNDFYSNDLSISCWVYPNKQSSTNSRIILNESNNKFTGLVFNSNGEFGRLGLMWNSSLKSSPVDLPIKIENNAWTHIIVIIKNSGIIKIFQNGVYSGNINLDYELPKVEFVNLRIGGFCGMLDDLQIFDYILDYGNVAINNVAQNNVSYLFNLNRITGELDVLSDELVSENNSPFYYLQPSDYVSAHENYNLQKIYNQKYYTQESMFTIEGGLNEGNMAVANGKFRTFAGRITT